MPLGATVQPAVQLNVSPEIPVVMPASPSPMVVMVPVVVLIVKTRLGSPLPLMPKCESAYQSWPVEGWKAMSALLPTMPIVWPDG